MNIGMGLSPSAGGRRDAVHQQRADVLDGIAARAARTTSTLLITGETGVGKGRLARWIHHHGPRAAGPFVPVNCGAIPEDLVDSQLFGHARGAFSGAEQSHPGMIRAADGGTVLLDEIGELSPGAQTRLLRLLEEREVQPVGHARPVSVDVRIIAATNRDLADAVARGAFREDLFYRLDVIRLEIPPLRARAEEIPRLVDEFNVEFAATHGRVPLRLDDDAIRCLADHPWPGNVRQLRTVVERLHILCPTDDVTVDDLRLYAQLAPTNPAPAPVLNLDAMRRRTVLDTLDACAGNVSRAASVLGVHRSTIYRWLGPDRRLTA